jgi:hypothetical protein
MKMGMKRCIKLMVNRIFGRKYYAVVVGERGSNRYDLTSSIHHTREEAENHRLRIEQTRSYIYVETICFRSRLQY